jgi:hypothetical protein
VNPHEFSFAIELSGAAGSRDMLSELVSRMLGHVGCACEAIPGIVDALQKAVVRARLGGRIPCSVRFTAHAGELTIDVSSGARSVWNLSQPIA